jgi:RNA recognition motif-containing protein
LKAQDFLGKRRLGMSKKIYVGNIPFKAVEQDIRDLFSEYGEIESLKIIKDKFTGQSKGFGFIEMVNEDDAKKVISSLDGKTFMGKTLKVSEARPQQKRHGFSDRRGGYGGGRGWR